MIYRPARASRKYRCKYSYRYIQIQIEIQKKGTGWMIHGSARAREPASRANEQGFPKQNPNKYIQIQMQMQMQMQMQIQIQIQIQMQREIKRAVLMNKGSPSGSLTLLTAGASGHFLSAYPASARREKHNRTSSVLQIQMQIQRQIQIPGLSQT